MIQEKQQFTLHEKQIEFLSDKHRFKVVNAGRRFGKSTAIAWDMFARAISIDKARIPYYAPTRDDARDIMWTTLKEICAPLLVGEPNESRLELHIRNKFNTVSLIVLYGWEAVQERGKGVGVKNHHIYLDEVAKYKNFDFGWQEILSPTLLDSKGGATFISTPNGFNHFYDLSLLPGTNTDWAYFHYTSYDNPYLDPEEIEKKKAEITADRFAQEYMGEFRKKEGLVYKEFSRFKHVIDKLPDDFEPVYTYGGVDWGHTHPCAIITVEKDYNGCYWITDEFYKIGQTESMIVDKVVSLNFNKVFPDPENASGIAALKAKGVNLREVNKNKGSVVSGISKVQELIKQGRLKVLSNCVNVIREFEGYSYPDDKGKMASENPLKENDDAMDALRYVLMTDVDRPQNQAPSVHFGNNGSSINRINFSKFK